MVRRLSSRSAEVASPALHTSPITEVLTSQWRTPSGAASPDKGGGSVEIITRDEGSDCVNTVEDDGVGIE